MTGTDKKPQTAFEQSTEPSTDPLAEELSPAGAEPEEKPRFLTAKRLIRFHLSKAVKVPGFPNKAVRRA